jgi:lipopolysaccharide transport system permease protein
VPAPVETTAASVAAAPAEAREPELRPAGPRRIGRAAFAAMVLHLTVRELRSSHHLTLLGWGWPVVRQLAQLAVLVFIFGKVFNLDVENYPVFVFVGLMAWTWFAGALTGASTSVLAQRHLVMQPRLPASMLPIVAVAVPLVDVLFALPVLIVMLALSTGVSWGLLLCPALIALQFVLLAGLGWLAAAIGVFFRDVPNIITVALLILFYVTPVFYDRSRVPARFHWVLDLNPMTTIIDAYRWLLLGTPSPGGFRLAAVAGASAALAGLGHRAFTRLAPRFADHL